MLYGTIRHHVEVEPMSKRSGRKRKIKPPPSRQPLNRTLVVGIIIAAVAAVALLIFSGLPGSNAVIDPEPRTYPLVDKRSMGNEDAPVLMVEYSDFQCPFCGRFHEDKLPLIVENYISTGKVYFVYRNFTILGTPSFRASKASLCAAEQDSFWPYHDYLFANQDETDPNAFSSERLEIFAERVGMDTGEFRECFIDDRTHDQIDAEFEQAGANGAESTPTFFINGTLLRGAQDYEVFQKQIDSALALAGESSPP